MNVDPYADEYRAGFWGWLRRWWRVLTVGLIVSLVAGGLILALQPQRFQARAALLVGTALENANPSPEAVQASANLAHTYADLATSTVVLQGVIDTLSLERGPEQLAGQVTARVRPGSQVVEIEAVDADPQAAQAIAGAIVQALAQRTPAGREELQAAMDFCAQQLAEMQESIVSLQARQRQLTAAAPTVTQLGEPVGTESEMAEVSARLEAERTAYAGLLSAYREGSINALTVIDPAGESVPVRMPALPVLGAAALIGLAASAAGIGLSQGAVTALRWRETAPLTCTGLPVLGAIGEAPPEVGPLCSFEEAAGPPVESFHELAANIQLGGPPGAKHTLLITSPGRQDGKSFVAANLALALASAGASVVLVDAHLRRPAVHKLFGVEDEHGLGDALARPRGLTRALLRRTVRPSGREGLSLVSAGPADRPLALYVPQLRDLLRQLREQFDYVVIDGPSAGGLAPDAGILAALASQTLLVIHSGITREWEVRRCKRAIVRRPGADVTGVIYNRAQRLHSPLREPARPAAAQPEAAPPAARRRRRAEVTVEPEPKAQVQRTTSRRSPRKRPAGVTAAVGAKAKGKAAKREAMSKGRK